MAYILQVAIALGLVIPLVLLGPYLLARYEDEIYAAFDRFEKWARNGKRVK